MARNQDAAAADPNPENPENPALDDAASISSSNTTTTTTSTIRAHNTSDLAPLLPQNNNKNNKNKRSSPPVSRRPGEAIMSSNDPSTAALRAWAREKQLQYPGQDGSFASGGVGTGGDGMGWGADSWILPRMGEKERRMEAERLRRKDAEKLRRKGDGGGEERVPGSGRKGV